jgi:hypothetical protein
MKTTLRNTLIVQAALLLWTSIILDGGALFTLVRGGIIAHWATVAYLAARRRNALTPFDQVLILTGYLIYPILWAVIASIVVEVVGV